MTKLKCRRCRRKTVYGHLSWDVRGCVEYYCLTCGERWFVPAPLTKEQAKAWSKTAEMILAVGMQPPSQCRGYVDGQGGKKKSGGRGRKKRKKKKKPGVEFPPGFGL